MQAPHLPADEAARLAALHATGLLDTAPEERFDRITRLAARLFKVPIALVSLVDANRQWLKSRQGLSVFETPRDISFCGHTILGDEPLVIADATADPRFADNPLVTGVPHIRFYAGVPLATSAGHKLGALCLIDTRPRTLDEEARQNLVDLAAWARTEVNALRLAEVDRLKSEFLATAAHELRTPMAGIQGFAELLARKGFGDTERQEMADIIRQEAEKLSQLVNELLDLARIEARQGRDFNIHSQPLAPIVEATLAALPPAAAARVRAAIAPDLPPVPVDARKLQQALSKLVSHALKFSPGGEMVSVFAESAADGVDIRVRDQGLGMTPEQEARAFERFYRAHPEIPDSGLGLALVKEIIQVLGGSVQLASRSGQGTEVTLHLPA